LYYDHFRSAALSFPSQKRRHGRNAAGQPAARTPATMFQNISRERQAVE